MGSGSREKNIYMEQYTLQEINPKQHKKSVYTHHKILYYRDMNEEEQFQKFEDDLIVFANQYSVTRLKISTVNFDREYRRGVAGNFQLVSTKAIIRVLGKTTKVPIGEGCEFETYAAAYEATKQHWSEYYRGIRAKRSPEQVAAEHRRQKRYRERRKDKDTELKRQQ